jgi:hypothetical protein
LVIANITISWLSIRIYFFEKVVFEWQQSGGFPFFICTFVPLNFSMKLYFSIIMSAMLITASCQDDTKVRAIEQEKERQKSDVIYNSINNGWNFNMQSQSGPSSELLASWVEWRLFINELIQKPKSSLGAFKQKAVVLSKRANDLQNNIPFKYDKPEIKSRIAVVTTKINAINLYINLSQIPVKKIIKLVQEVNYEVSSIQSQLEEIKIKSEIKIEEGENDLIRILDTTRAIPSTPVPKITN